MDFAEIWVRLMPGMSCAGEGRTVLVKILLHRTRSLDAFLYSNLTEAVTFFFCNLVVPVWNVGRDWTVYRQFFAVFLSHFRQMPELP